MNNCEWFEVNIEAMVKYFKTDNQIDRAEWAKKGVRSYLVYYSCFQYVKIFHIQIWSKQTPEAIPHATITK